MSNLDMSEAIGLLAQEKGISEDALLHVLVDALASAYKRRPDAADEVVVEVNPETMDFAFIAYDVDEDGNWVNERDDTPKKEELGRIAARSSNSGFRHGHSARGCCGGAAQNSPSHCGEPW